MRGGNYDDGYETVLVYQRQPLIQLPQLEQKQQQLDTAVDNFAAVR
jgi:hypothetical protein